jgi:hypothetical protein
MVRTTPSPSCCCTSRVSVFFVDPVRHKSSAPRRGKLHVDNGADDLYDSSATHVAVPHFSNWLAFNAGPAGCYLRIVFLDCAFAVPASVDRA